MKIKTKELVGAALDWLVAKCEGAAASDLDPMAFTMNRNAAGMWNYTKAPAQGQPILEREVITTTHDRGYDFDQPWRCALSIDPYNLYEGPTMLIAGLRCYVASKLGEEVEVPGELS